MTLGVPSQSHKHKVRSAKRAVSAGFAHHQAGRLARAEALYRIALVREPDHAEALHLLGVIAYQSGKNEEAIELIERALPALRELPEAHLNLGNALRAAGRFAEAADCYRCAIALDPDYGMAYSNLALALNEQGSPEAALQSARRAVELLPGFVGAHINHAAAAAALRRFAEAEPSLRRALAMRPDEPKLLSDLGRVLTELGCYGEAIACHRRAITLDADNATLHFGLGWTQYVALDPKGSETTLRHTLSICPEFAQAWQLLGNSLSAQGRFEEALACHRRALELEPDLLEALHSLARAGELRPDEARFKLMRRVLEREDSSTRDRIEAGFALGSALDRAARYDEAFSCFAEANSLYRQQRAELGERFVADAFAREIDRLIRTFSPASFLAMADWGYRSELPVFIVGMPRSGTSLVEQIAASHSRVFGAGERPEMGRTVAALMAHNDGRPIKDWDAEFAHRAAREHVAHLREIGGVALRVIDKVPDNVLLLGIIAGLFPGARVILCRRDARDTCLSCYFRNFEHGHLFSYDLADCGRRFCAVERLSSHWLSVMPLRMMVVNYEQLVADLESEGRHLIEFLGLDWEPACLEFHKTKRSTGTGSFWEVRQPLFTRSVGRWRNYERHLEPLLAELSQASRTG